MKLNETKIKQIIAEEMHAIEDKMYFDHTDKEGGMAKRQLYRMAEYAMELHDILEDDTQLEAWVQSKITIASEYMAKVKHYLEHEMGLVGDVEPKGQDSEPLMVVDGEESYEITDEDEYLMET